MVRVGVSTDHLLLATCLWKIVHILLNQVGISGCSHPIRNRLLHLRHRPQFNRIDLGQSCCWYGCCWCLFWRSSDHLANRSSAPATCVPRYYWWYVWYCVCCWTSVSIPRVDTLRHFTDWLCSMGGAFTDRVSWRWCFYINLPFGAVTAIFIIVFFHLPNKENPIFSFTLWEQLKMMDLEGTGLFIPGIICLLLALQWGGTTYAWDNGRIIALFILFGILMIGFIAVQIWKQDRATVPPRIFKNRNVWGCAMFIGFMGANFMVMTYYVCFDMLAYLK